MNDVIQNKQTVLAFIQAVWVEHNLSILERFWTEDCINHAMSGGENSGILPLRTYHEQFFAAFAAFSDLQIEILQQIAEDDKVVTYIRTQGKHTNEFVGVPATGKTVFLMSMRIDRLEGNKIAEHWSVADMAGLMQQLQS